MPMTGRTAPASSTSWPAESGVSGLETPPQPPIETDAVVIGAGPVGLFQVFELGLLDIRAHVIDTLEQPGGQCIELYPDKPIYDIPGLPRCTGRELVERLMQQARPFEPVFHLGQQVAALRRQADGRFLVQTSRGQRLMARAVVIAAGVGAFQPRTLKLEGLERFEGTQVLYRASDPTQWAGRHLLVVGGEDAALEAALALARTHDPEVLVEAFITGDEYTVSIVNREVLPAIKLETPREFYDYEAKYHATTTRYLCPAGLSASGEAEMANLARLAFNAVGAEGWGRVDFMRDATGQPWLIELNLVPGMTDHSLVPMAARVSGWSFEELVARILESSFEARA